MSAENQVHVEAKYKLNIYNAAKVFVWGVFAIQLFLAAEAARLGVAGQAVLHILVAIGSTIGMLLFVRLVECAADIRKEVCKHVD